MHDHYIPWSKKSTENFAEIYNRLSDLKSSRQKMQFKTVKVFIDNARGLACRKRRILKMMEFFLDEKWSPKGFDQDGKTDISTLRQIVRNCKLFSSEGNIHHIPELEIINYYPK